MSIQLLQTGCAIPLLLRIRRILLPTTPPLAPCALYPCVCVHVLLHTSHNLDLGNTVAVPQDNTNLRRGNTLPGELADLLDDLVGRGLQPRWRGARVRDGRVGDTLALAVHTTHGGGVESCCRCRLEGGCCRRRRR